MEFHFEPVLGCSYLIMMVIEFVGLTAAFDVVIFLLARVEWSDASKGAAFCLQRGKASPHL